MHVRRICWVEWSVVHEGEQYTLKEKTSHLRWLSLRKKFGYEGDGDTRWYEGEEAKKVSFSSRAGIEAREEADGERGGDDGLRGTL